MWSEDNARTLFVRYFNISILISIKCKNNIVLRQKQKCVDIKYKKQPGMQ